MSNINKAAVLNPFTDLTTNILDYVPRATTSEFGIVAIGSGINVDALGRIYLDTQEYSDRLTAIETGLGVANGIATLDSNGQVPSSQLPSYVDDVLEFLNVAAFPATGVTGKIYVETTGNTTYRWGGAEYIKITSGEVSSVAGKKGVVTLTKDDVGLSNVDNTNDLSKPLSTATQTALAALENKGKRGIINLYDTSLIYGLNERVVLANGDIVKSTIDGNVNDPNVNMSGWVADNKASQIKYENGIDAQTVKNRIVYIQDFGGSSTNFDPSVAEAEAKAVANPNSKPYDGARQFAFPMKTLKVWNYCDGYLDRGAVASIRNVDSFSSNEPRTEVLGINSSEQLASYTDRDVVGLYVHSEGQPALLTSTNTTYTATTVTCPDIESKRNFIRKDQIVDVVDGSIKYSSRIQGIDGNTVTVDGWYIHGTSNSGVPSNSSQAKFVPNTKVWATNFNVMLKPESDAESMVGIELGAFNNKYPAGAGYGYDIWSGGQYRIGAAFQARGQYTTGLYLYDRCDTGTIVSNPNIGHLIVGSGAPDTYGVLSHKQAISFLSRGATVYGYAQVTESGGFLTGTNSDGAWANLKYSYRVISSGQTIGDNPVSITNPTAAGQDIFLPDASSSAFRTVCVKNISTTYDVYVGGVVEGGTGSVLIKPHECVQLFCDGYTWFILSHYKPTVTTP